MAVASVETVEWTLDGGIRCHYDVPRDVLYLRLISRWGKESYSEDTDDGLTLVHDAETDEVIGLTVVSFWKRFGRDAVHEVPLAEIGAAIQKMAALLPREPAAAIAV